MSGIDARIIGHNSKDSKKTQVQVLSFETSSGEHSGLVALTHSFLSLNSEVHPFLNPSFGTSMNQNVSFGAIASVINSGGTTTNADSGTTDGATTAFKLIQSGQNFSSTVVVGMGVQNTTDGSFSTVTVVDSNTLLTLADDIMETGETYVIDPVWPGTAVQGAWNFADSGKITLTAGNNNDSATFDTVGTIFYDSDNFTAMTGKIDLDIYSPVLNDIFISLLLSGISVGDTICLNEIIDTGNFSEQNFVIPMDNFNLGGGNFDSMKILLTRSGGAKPTFKFDDLQLEASGTPLVFEATTPKGTRFHVDEIRISLVDNITGITTVAGATENATMPALSYNKIMGIPLLSNGIVFSRFQSNETAFAINLRQLVDFLGSGGEIINIHSDGVNTSITLLIKFSEPVILDGSKGDSLSFTINDDLSGLVIFSAVARGGLEM